MLGRISNQRQLTTIALRRGTRRISDIIPHLLSWGVSDGNHCTCCSSYLRPGFKQRPTASKTLSALHSYVVQFLGIRTSLLPVCDCCLLIYVRHGSSSDRGLTIKCTTRHLILGIPLSLLSPYTLPNIQHPSPAITRLALGAVFLPWSRIPESRSVRYGFRHSTVRLYG